MKKWSFLVATLLLMGATATTFTSCVDTDEPEGILEMRKAKAEYISALAAVENAKIAYQQAAAQTEQANADLLRAKAEAEKAQAEIAKAQAQSAIIQAEAAAKAAEIVAEGQKALDEAKAEIAKAEAAKILAEAADEEARTQQLIAENQIKLKEYEAKLQVVLQNEETNLVKAKAQYEAALKDIAAMELVLSPKESAVLAAAKTAYTTAESKLSAAYGKIITAQKALLTAMYGDEDDYETLQKNLADAQADLAAMNQVVADLEELANSVEISDFEKQRDDLKEKYGYTTNAPSVVVGGSYKVAIDSLNVLIAQAKRDNKDLEKAWDDAKQATKDATAKITEATNKKYTVDAVEVTITDGTVAKALESQTGYEAKKNDDGSYTYKLKVAKQENKTLADMKANTFAPTSSIEKWLDALKPSQNIEDLGANDIKLKAAQEDLVEKQKEYDKKVEAFNNMLKQHLDKKAIVTVETKVVDDAVKAYNDALKTLQDKVADYNETYDKQTAAVAAALKTATDAEYAKLVGVDELAAQKAEYAKQLEGAQAIFNGNTLFTAGEISGKATIAEIEALVNSKNSDIVNATKTLADAKKLDAAKTIKKVEDSSDYKNALRNTFATVGAYDDYVKTQTDAAAAAAKLSKTYLDAQNAMIYALTAADKAIAEATTKADKSGVADKLAAMPKANADYAKLAKDNAQIIVDDKGKDVVAADQAAYAAKLVDTATAVGAKYIKPGDAKDIADDAKTKVTSEWVIASVELKKDAAYYTATGHKEVVRKAISDDTVKALTAVAYNAKYGEDAWKNASNDAFGVLRYVAVSEAKNSTDEVKDEVTNKFQTVGGALAALLKAQEALANCKISAGTNEAANDAIKAINAAKAKVDAVIAAAQKAVDDAKQAETDAKAAEKAAKENWEATYSKFEKEQQNKATTKKYEDNLLTALNNAIASYYNNTYVEYEDETGTVIRVKVADVQALQDWVKSTVKNYTKKAGKIEKQQEKVADYEKVVKRLEENNYSHTDKDGALHDYIISDKEYDVELAQKEYDYIKSEFENAQANLAKVIEALGNGVAGVAGITEGTTASGATGGSSSYTGFTSSGTSTNITL